jgi:hypothetical protein
MLLVQKYHSINDIDPEFISSIEVLLQEEMPSFQVLQERHDGAPASDVFTYFLFFGPTQNTPIGFAQLSLRKIPHEGLYPWWKRIFMFWRKEYENWKQISWKIGPGAHGLCIFDPKYARSGREKVQELIKDYEQRAEIEAQELMTVKGLQDFQISWPGPAVLSTECYVLEPLFKSVKTYEAYLGDLRPEIQAQIKAGWKKLHRQDGIQLGDYASLSEVKKKLPVSDEQEAAWVRMRSQFLTFEKDDTVLGCLQVTRGKNGNIFFEPFPFEPEEGSLVSDELYTQYALLKFFEMEEARKCHLTKFGGKLIFEEKEDLHFFLDQGFQAKTLVRAFYSRLPKLQRPV